MDGLLDEPENAPARQAIGRVSMKILEKERSARDAQRKQILRDAWDLNERRKEKEKKWKIWLEKAESARRDLPYMPLVAYDLYLKILYENPDHKQALAGIDILQKLTALEVGSEGKIPGSREAALRGFYFYCSGDAARAQRVWSLLLKWGADKNMPLSDEVIRDYLDMANSSLKAERLITAELSSRGEQVSPARLEMGVKAAKVAIKKARMAIWKTNYVKAMKQIDLVLKSSCTEKSQKRGFEKKRNQARKLKMEILERFVVERDFRHSNARAHMVRGLLQYSRNKLARAMSEWGGAIEWNPDDSFSKDAWQVASALEMGKALARATRTPLQLESIRVNLGKIAKLESAMPPEKAKPVKPELVAKKPPARIRRAACFASSGPL